MIRRVIRRLAAPLAARRFASVGQGLVFDPLSSRFRGSQNIRIGDRVFIGHGADFSIHEGLEIGDDVLFGPGVMILSGNHPIDNVGQTINAFHDGLNGSCRIGRDAWIGARAIIVGEVNIGEGAVIGAASLVNRDVPPYSVVAGTPCRPLRYRFSDDQLHEHLAALGRPQTADALIATRAAAFANAGKGRPA